MATLWFLARKVPVFFAPVESEKIIWETSGWSGLDGIHPDTPEGSNCPPPCWRWSQVTVVTLRDTWWPGVMLTQHRNTWCKWCLNFPSLQTILKAMSEIVSVEILVLCELKAMFSTTQQGMKYEIFMNQLVKHGLTQGYCIEHSWFVIYTCFLYVYIFENKIVMLPATSLYRYPQSEDLVSWCLNSWWAPGCSHGVSPL